MTGFAFRLVMARMLASEAARRKGMDGNGGGQRGGRGGQGVGKEDEGAKWE